MFIHLFVCFLSSLEEKKACSSRGLACHDREGVELEAGVAVRKEITFHLHTGSGEREQEVGPGYQSTLNDRLPSTRQ